MSKDATERELEKYILGSFKVLPKDVIKLVLSQLDRDVLLNMCQTSSEFAKFCKSKEARTLIDMKDLEYLQRQTPIAAPIRSLTDQVNLVRRGFKTVYSCIYDVDAVEADKVTFGLRDGDIEDPYVYFIFSIVGLPPAKGTKVWILLDAEISMGPEARPQAEVYLSKEEALEADQGSRMFILKDMAHDQGGGEPGVKAALRQLATTGHYGDFYLFEVALP